MHNVHPPVRANKRKVELLMYGMAGVGHGVGVGVIAVAILILIALGLIF